MNYEQLKKEVKELGMSIKDFSEYLNIKENSVWVWKQRGVPHHVEIIIGLMKENRDFKIASRVGFPIIEK